MLYQFLKDNKTEILGLTERKSLELAGVRPSSDQLKNGLPIFYQQLIGVLELQERTPHVPWKDTLEMQKAATESNEPAMSKATGHATESFLAETAGRHGQELMRLGYTLSHVVHAYGSMCQSITEFATEKKVDISAQEFRDLNRCLDVAIAGAVTEFQMNQDRKEKAREIEHLGFLAHELRNALMSITVSFDMIKKGAVGVQSNTATIMETSLKRMRTLIDQSLTEVRLRVDPKVHPEKINLLSMVNQINSTAEVEAKEKNQHFEISIDPDLEIEVDQQFLYSAISNLIQNAIKYGHKNSSIQIRGTKKNDEAIIEVEDECGGLTDVAVNLFRPYEQQNENKKGLGLGLTIAQKAIILNHGKIAVRNLPDKGCIFQIILPLIATKKI